MEPYSRMKAKEGGGGRSGDARSVTAASSSFQRLNGVQCPYVYEDGKQCEYVHNDRPNYEFADHLRGHYNLYKRNGCGQRFRHPRDVHDHRKTVKHRGDEVPVELTKLDDPEELTKYMADLNFPENPHERISILPRGNYQRKNITQRFADVLMEAGLLPEGTVITHDNKNTTVVVVYGEGGKEGGIEMIFADANDYDQFKKKVESGEATWDERVAEPSKRRKKESSDSPKSPPKSPGSGGGGGKA